MKTNDLVKKSITIITEYYENNLQPFFDSISEDVLWIGPAQRQEMRGKQRIIDAWSQEKHNLTFTMGEIRALCLPVSSSINEIILHYDIYTHHPSGNTHIHDQRLHFTWRKKRPSSGGQPFWELVVIHISNAWPYDAQDNIYPVHYENLSLPTRTLFKPQTHITLKSIDRNLYYVATSDIVYIEKLKATSRISVQTTSSVIITNAKLQDMERQCPNLVRIHAGYIINPAYTKVIRRFAVTMSDGREFPIPEKKYTKIKKILTEKGSALL